MKEQDFGAEARKAKTGPITVFDHTETMKGLAGLLVTDSLHGIARERAVLQLKGFAAKVVHAATPDELVLIKEDLRTLSPHPIRTMVSTEVLRTVGVAENVDRTMKRARLRRS